VAAAAVAAAGAAGAGKQSTPLFYFIYFDEKVYFQTKFYTFE
jgi:hypothetical protein